MTTEEFLTQVRAEHYDYAGVGKCAHCGTWDYPCTTERLARAVEAVTACLFFGEERSGSALTSDVRAAIAEHLEGQ